MEVTFQNLQLFQRKVRGMGYRTLSAQKAKRNRIFSRRNELI